MPRVFINNCSIEELMSVPGIGAKVADTILDLREAKGDLELDDLNQVPYLRITQPLLDCLNFTSFENKERMGSPYDRHNLFLTSSFLKMASRNKLLPVWGSHLGNTRATETRAGVYTRVGKGYFFFFYHGKNLKISNLVCQSYLRIFP
jgi:hypothetical protein